MGSARAPDHRRTHGAATCEGSMGVETVLTDRGVSDVSKIQEIADMTAAFYEQEAVMYYKISDEVVIKEYPEYKDA